MVDGLRNLESVQQELKCVTSHLAVLGASGNSPDSEVSEIYFGSQPWVERPANTSQTCRGVTERRLGWENLTQWIRAAYDHCFLRRLAVGAFVRIGHDYLLHASPLRQKGFLRDVFVATLDGAGSGGKRAPQYVRSIFTPIRSKLQRLVDSAMETAANSKSAASADQTPPRNVVQTFLEKCAEYLEGFPCSDYVVSKADDDSDDHNSARQESSNDLFDKQDKGLHFDCVQCELIVLAKVVVNQTMLTKPLDNEIVPLDFVDLDAPSGNYQAVSSPGDSESDPIGFRKTPSRHGICRFQCSCLACRKDLPFTSANAAKLWQHPQSITEVVSRNKAFCQAINETKLTGGTWSQAIPATPTVRWVFGTKVDGESQHPCYFCIVSDWEQCDRPKPQNCFEIYQRHLCRGRQQLMVRCLAAPIRGAAGSQVRLQSRLLERFEEATLEAGDVVTVAFGSESSPTNAASMKLEPHVTLHITATMSIRPDLTCSAIAASHRVDVNVESSHSVFFREAAILRSLSRKSARRPRRTRSFDLGPSSSHRASHSAAAGPTREPVTMSRKDFDRARSAALGPVRPTLGTTRAAVAAAAVPAGSSTSDIDLAATTKRRRGSSSLFRNASTVQLLAAKKKMGEARSKRGPTSAEAANSPSHKRKPSTTPSAIGVPSGQKALTATVTETSSPSLRPEQSSANSTRPARHRGQRAFSELTTSELMLLFFEVFASVWMQPMSCLACYEGVTFDQLKTSSLQKMSGVDVEEEMLKILDNYATNRHRYFRMLVRPWGVSPADPAQSTTASSNNGSDNNPTSSDQSHEGAHTILGELPHMLQKRIKSSQRAGAPVPAAVSPDVSILAMFLQSSGNTISTSQWFTFFQHFHRVDALGMHVLVPCDGSLDTEVPLPKLLPSDFHCFYGIIANVYDDDTVLIKLESGREFRMGFDELVSVQNRCGFGWRVEGEWPIGDDKFAWFPGVTKALDADPAAAGTSSVAQRRSPPQSPQKGASTSATEQPSAVGIAFDDGDEKPNQPLSQLRLPELGRWKLSKDEIAAHRDSAGQAKRSRGKKTKRASDRWPFFVRKNWFVQLPTSRRKHKKRSGHQQSRVGVVTSVNVDDLTCVVLLCGESRLLTPRRNNLSVLPSSNSSSSSSSSSSSQSPSRSDRAADNGRCSEEVTISVWKLQRWRPSQLQGLTAKDDFRHCLQTESALQSRFVRGLADLHRMGLITDTRAGKVNFESDLPPKLKRTVYDVTSIGWNDVAK